MKRNQGAESKMANSLCHFELMSGDVERSKEFYGAVFDWKFDNASMPGYTLVDTGHEPAGGIFAKPSEKSAACMNAYFKVENIEQSLKIVVQHGGKILVPKTQIPHVGHFAMFADPDGVAIGIMQQGS